MTEQAYQPGPLLSDWTGLAQGRKKGASISRCPVGHVHLDYRNLAIRLENDEFLAFASMVAQAAARLGGTSPLLPPPSAQGMGNSFSLN